MAEPIVTKGQRAAALPTNRLAFFQVLRLFDQFDYQIPLNLERRVTAIIAPNGSGKTICLRLIDALFSKRWSLFNEVQFASIEYRFVDGQRILVQRKRRPKNPAAPEELVEGSGFVVKVYVSADVANPVEYAPEIPPERQARLQVERYLPFLTRTGVNQFVHDQTRIAYSLQQVVEIWGDQIPPQYRTSIYGDEPKELAALLGAVDCHLIETQRLLVLRDSGEDNYRAGRQQPSTSLAISRKAERLRVIIAQQLTAYATLSQSLDRTFPKRVIERQDVLRPEDLLASLRDLDREREELTAAGILDKEADNPVELPEGELDPAISRVLSVYARDTATKLHSLFQLLRRVALFKELVDGRLITKHVFVSKTSGFEVRVGDRAVPLEKLSSGEQHQLVLFFELLFELRENALILIDEPELSLHVAWQKKFISDLNRIIELNKFDVILATHSPQLTSRWTDLVVELGKVDDE